MFAEINKTWSWDILERPITIDGDTNNNYKALVRSDNHNLLHICKKGYTPATNAKLTEISQKLANISGMQFEGFSEFQNGCKTLCYFKNTERQFQVGDFPIEDYMIIGNSHDYSSSFFIGTSTVLIRCMNQFSRVKQNIRYHHSSNLNEKIDGLVNYFETYKTIRDQLIKQFQNMILVPISEPMKFKFIDYTLNISNPNEISSQKSNQRELLLNLVNSECLEVGENYYGALNGLTNYTTHIKELRKNKPKVFGNVFGKPAELNNRGFDFIQTQIADYYS
jgi:hypothetical protein